MRFSNDDVHRLRIALGRISRRVDRHSTATEMTRTKFLLLSTIARQGPIGMGELAKIEGLNPTMLSRLVGRLAERGLVARTAGAEDKRVVFVQATDEGRALHNRVRAERTAVFADHLRGLGDDDEDALLRALPALETLADHIPVLPEHDQFLRGDGTAGPS